MIKGDQWGLSSSVCTGLEQVYLEFYPQYQRERETISDLSRASGLFSEAGHLGKHNYKHMALLPPCESLQMRESGRGSAPTLLPLAPPRQDDEAVLIGSKS